MTGCLLAIAGHDVQVATNPSQASSAAETFRPDIAILDIGLPEIDGYTLGQELRARLGDLAPVLVALTGYGQEQDRRRSEEAGFALHFLKPVDSKTLVHALDQLSTSLSRSHGAGTTADPPR